MVKIFLIPLFLFSLILSSCGREEGASERRLRRPKSEESGQRQRPFVRAEDQGQGASQPGDLSQQGPSATGQTAVKRENFVFPVSFQTSGHTTMVLTKPTPGEPKISIFARPKPIPMALIAGLSGRLSITTEGKYYNVSIESADNRTLHFEELIIKHTKFIVSNGTSLKQKQQWATTKRPFIFYITKNGHLLEPCISIESNKINIVKKYTDPPSCGENFE